MAIITPQSLIRTPSGKAWRAYSGVRGTGAEAAVSVTLLDIARSPEQDLLCKVYYGFDSRSLGAGEYIGLDIAIDGDTIILFNQTIVGAQIGDISNSQGQPIVSEFILPRNTKLTIIGVCTDTNNGRYATLWGFPI